jgi:hypothetical protein
MDVQQLDRFGSVGFCKTTRPPAGVENATFDKALATSRPAITSSTPTLALLRYQSPALYIRSS